MKLCSSPYKSDAYIYSAVFQSADVEALEEKVRKMVEDDLHVSLVLLDFFFFFFFFSPWGDIPRSRNNRAAMGVQKQPQVPAL